MALRPGDLRFDHPKITKRFFEGGSLVLWAHYRLARAKRKGTGLRIVCPLAPTQVTTPK